MSDAEQNTETREEWLERSRCYAFAKIDALSTERDALEARLADERSARAKTVVRLGKARELLQELYSNSSDRYMAKEIANWLGFAEQENDAHG